MRKLDASKSNVFFDLVAIAFGVMLLAVDCWEMGKQRHVYTFQPLSDETDVTRNKELDEEAEYDIYENGGIDA